MPSDVVLAARFVASNSDPSQIVNQPWDDSVKSLARYPEVLKWMDQNLDWTTAVGDVFIDQPADVMNSVQRLRTGALAAGNLFDTPQQTIIKEETSIRIVPTEPESIDCSGIRSGSGIRATLFAGLWSGTDIRCGFRRGIMA